VDVKFTEPRVRICVLGGTGFVGTELITHLAAAGHWVRVPTRSLSHGAHLTVLPTVELIEANIHDARVLGELLSGMDVAINLVGILNERGGARFRDVHVELATKLIEEARRARVPRLLHMSSLGADAERAPSRYLRSKGQAEARVSAAGPFLEYTIFRPSVIFGPRDSLTNRFTSLLRLSRGVLPLARPRTRFAPVYVHDVALAFMRALYDRSTIGRTFELCGPDVLTLGQIVRATAAVAHLRCWIIPLPDVLARLQGVALGWLPGAPFSLDNFRSLTLDSVCRENGCAALQIEPRHMAAVLPTYLGDQVPEARLDRYRQTAER